MLPKPEACKGCPFYGDGKGFVPDEIRDDAEVFIYAQNPGADEERGSKISQYSYRQPEYVDHPPAPLLGATGYQMEREFLPVTGYTRDQLSVGNALRCRHRHINWLPPLKIPEVQKALAHCHNAHFKIPKSTKLIVAMGEYAMHALTQEGLEKDHKVSDWRGYLLPFEPVGEPRTHTTDIYTPRLRGPMYPTPVLVVNHLAMLFRSPSGTILAKRDWSKIPRIVAGKWPEIPPPIRLEPPAVWPRKFAFDTEYIPETGYFIRYSMANEHPLQPHLIVRVVERDQTVLSAAWGQPEPTAMVHRPKLILHNAAADLTHFEQLALADPTSYDIEDTMHLHAVLWSGLPHDLNTLGSLYARINRWKHLERVNPVLYSAMDAVGTWDVFKHLDAERERDPQTSQVYYDIQLKLVNIIRRAQEKGIKINQETAMKYLRDLKGESDELRTKGEALVGWPINIGSDQQTEMQLYQVERIPDFIFPKKKA